MIIVSYVTPSGKTFNGILIRRDKESGMIDVAFDSDQDRPMMIGWMDTNKQMGKVTMKSASSFRWNHDALRLIESGKIEEARELYRLEEDKRMQERLRKERSV